MRKVDLNLIYEESFVDSLIKNSTIDLENKKIFLKVDGAYLNDDQVLSETEILINNWDRLDIVKRENNFIEKVTDFHGDFLSSIIEFHYDGTQLRLVGLGMGFWIEWIFANPKIEIYGEINKD